MNSELKKMEKKIDNLIKTDKAVHRKVDNYERYPYERRPYGYGYRRRYGYGGYGGYGARQPAWMNRIMDNLNKGVRSQNSSSSSSLGPYKDDNYEKDLEKAMARSERDAAKLYKEDKQKQKFHYSTGKSDDFDIEPIDM